MLLPLGAASAALDAIRTLTTPKPSSAQPVGFGPISAGAADNSTAPSGGQTSVTGLSVGAKISPDTISALLAAQSQSPTTSATSASAGRATALQKLFSQIDANGDGQISKSEFENALGAGGTNIAAADKVFNELDSNGDGSVSLGELNSALRGRHHDGHHHAHPTSSTGSTDADGSTTNGTTNGSVSSDPLLQAPAASSATTTSSSTNGGSGLSSLLTPVDSSQLTPISLSAASYARLDKLIRNSTFTTLSLST